VWFGPHEYWFAGLNTYGVCWLIAGCNFINTIPTQDELDLTLTVTGNPSLRAVVRKVDTLLARAKEPGAASLESIALDTSPDRKVTPNILAHIEFQWALYYLHERVGDLNIKFDYGQLKTAVDPIPYLGVPPKRRSLLDSFHV
jgi:hypothetical protein